jgi:flagellar FliL protein
MADEEQDSKEEGTEGKKKKSKLILIVIPLVVVLLGGGGFFAYKTFLAPKAGADEAGAEGGHAQKEGHGDKKGHGEKKGEGEGEGGESEGPAFFSLTPFVVNLQDNIGTRYLKISLKFELDEPDAEPELKGQLPKIRDALIILLSSKNYAEIGTVEGKYRLREEIIKRVNRFFEDTPVRGVYFTDFVIQ